MNKKGFFEDGNDYGFKRQSERELAKKPICFKPFADQYDAAKKIPDLASKLRAALEQIILDSPV